MPIPWVTDQDMALLVDLYELTMADSYLRRGMDDPVTFDLFVRRLPPGRSFLVAAGLEAAVHYLTHLRFSAEAIDYLRSLGRFSDLFLDYLKGFRFTGEVWAVPEGTVIFPPEPLLSVSAPRVQAQILETFLLNALNLETMIASKAARVTLACAGRGWVDFSPRRDHGADAAMRVARASYLAGALGTSNVLAGLRYGLPVYGTMAHAYVMSFDDELEAFLAFGRDFPQGPIFLIDTYDPLEGARRAAEAARILAREGIQVRGVRLDSGDLVGLSRKVRRILDEAGARELRIFLSGDLDEVRIHELLAAGAAADAFGVGTRLGTSADAPYVGGVYKLVEDRGRPRIKLSPGKVTLPGRKQVWRRRDGQGRMVEDWIALRDEPPPVEGAEPLLKPVLVGGEPVEPLPGLTAIRERVARELAGLPEPMARIGDEEEARYPIRLSSRLAGQVVALGGPRLERVDRWGTG